MTKTRSDLIQAWCEKGRRDFLTAQNALKDDREKFPDIICFHSQQSAEKYLKAYLVFLDLEFPKTHALEDLILIAATKDPKTRDLFTIACDLSPYAVEVRYPDSPSPTLADATDAVHGAEVIRTFVLEKISW